jgi:hypothetical protein
MVNLIINKIMCDKLEHGVATQENSATTRVIMALALATNLICLVLSNLTWNTSKWGAVDGGSSC